MLGEWKRLDRLANDRTAWMDRDETDRLHDIAIDHLERSAEAVAHGAFEIVRLCCVARWLATHGEMNEAMSAHVTLALRHIVVAARTASPDLPRLLSFLDVLSPAVDDWWVRLALRSLSRARLFVVKV